VIVVMENQTQNGNQQADDETLKCPLCGRYLTHIEDNRDMNWGCIHCHRTFLIYEVGWYEGGKVN